MEQWLSVDVLIWLFPIILMCHDFEEIIRVESWMKGNEARIESRLPPSLAHRMKEQFSLTTAQFAAAVWVVFLFVSASSYMGYQSVHDGRFGSMHFFIVTTLVIFLHVFTHLGQAVFFRSWTPGSVTSLVFVLPYSLLLYRKLFQADLIEWSTIWISLPFVLLVVPVLLMAHTLGRKLVRA